MARHWTTLVWECSFIVEHKSLGRAISIHNRRGRIVLCWGSRREMRWAWVSKPCQCGVSPPLCSADLKLAYHSNDLSLSINPDCMDNRGSTRALDTRQRLHLGILPKRTYRAAHFKSQPPIWQGTVAHCACCERTIIIQKPQCSTLFGDDGERHGKHNLTSWRLIHPFPGQHYVTMSVSMCFKTLDSEPSIRGWVLVSVINANRT